MSKKYEDGDKLSGWDTLVLIAMAGILITGTMSFTTSLPWYWPVGYFIALIFAVKAALRHDAEKKEEKAASGKEEV